MEADDPASIAERIAELRREHRALDERIVRLGTGLLGLKEMEHTGEVGRGLLQERLCSLCDCLLSAAESRHGRDPKAATAPERVRAQRYRIRKRLLDAEQPPSTGEKNALLDDLDRVFTALQAHSYIGDYLLAEGPLGRSRTGELSIFAERLSILAKALRPLPEKWHGLADVEARYRQRYLDLVANPESRLTFEIRARLVAGIRRFLSGTPPIVEAIGFGAAVDYLSALGMDAVRQHEIAMTQYALGALTDRFGADLKIYGPLDTAVRGGAVSFLFEGIHAHDISQVVDEEAVCVRAGHHCAKPLMRVLGVPATTRASFYVYNDEADADALIDALDRAEKFFAF